MDASRKLKILYTNAMYSPDIGGGAEIMLKAMAEGMKARGHHVQALVTHSGCQDTLEVVDGIPVNRLRLKNTYWPFDQRKPTGLKKLTWHLWDRINPLMNPGILRVLNTFKPDLLVSNNMPGLSVAIWLAAKKLNIPIVQILHDYYLVCPRSTMFKSGKTCGQQCRGCHHLRAPHQKLSNTINAVVGVSKAILNTHLANGYFSRTPIKSVIYNARPLPPAEQSRTTTGKMTFGYIGALTDIKGVQELIKSFKLLESHEVDFQLLIAGRGKTDFTHDLHELAKDDARIQFLGHTSPAVFFSQIDACVVPSIWNDPLPGVTYEALHYGVPVIGSTQGGIPEIIGSDRNGLLFDPAVPDALLAAMKTFAKTSATFQPKVDEKFVNADMMLAQYEALFLSAIDTSR